MNKRILIGFPVSNREWVLPYFLKHIENIDYDKKLIDIYCIVNNSKDASLQLMQDFKNKYKDEYNSIQIEIYNNSKYPKDERTTIIREQIYHFLSELRNKIISKCVTLNCDYLLSVDTDILVPNDILNRLLSHNKDYVAGLIYNGYLFTPRHESFDYNPILNAYKFPNILKLNSQNTYTHVVNYRVKNPNLNEKDTLLEVDFTGAVFLATQDVCKVAKFSWNVQGEDEPFCRTAREAGFKLYCDLSLYSQHMMSKQILDLYINENLKFSNGDVIKIT